MCGIGGILWRTPPRIPNDAADRLQAALLHRGPDDRGIYTSEKQDAQLVHSRLAILDLSSAGRQPMQRGRHWIVFNGELYNFRELRMELEREGEIFTTETDTEVLLALYVRHGRKAIARLRGMFAFAIWDKAERSCFLARDGFGIKPLYYGFSAKGDLVFASEVRALLASGLIERRLNAAGIDSFLTSGSVAEPLTLLAKVYCLEAGHWLHWREGKWKTARYFQIDFREENETADEAQASTQAALLDSVKHHFISDVPVGIFLSGGLDSGALVALARTAGRQNLATFSIALEDEAQDESGPARRLADFFGTQHHETLLTRELARHWAEPFLESLDQPTVDGFNTYCVCKLARDHGYKVVLSGLGGDEWFGGYPSFQQVPRLFQFGSALHPLCAIVRPAARGWERWAKTGHAARMAGYLQGKATLPNAYQTVRSIFGPLERNKIGQALLGEKWGQHSTEDEENEGDSQLPTDLGNAVSYLELTRYLRNQLLRDADVMSMAHGLELRVPLVDTQLFHSLRRTPSAWRLRSEKQALRDAVPNLPAWHGAQRKRGFSLPVGAWLNSTWQDFREDLSGAPTVPLDSWSRQWSLIVLHRWLRQHGFPGWQG
jgi:asparagine synthase (glutamine-hydrolysing)